MSVTKAYEEVIEFIAAGTNPQAVAEYRASDQTRARVGELVARAKAEGLPAEEASELQSYLYLEHIMRLAKARARRRGLNSVPLRTSASPPLTKHSGSVQFANTVRFATVWSGTGGRGSVRAGTSKPCRNRRTVQVVPRVR